MPVGHARLNNPNADPVSFPFALSGIFLVVEGADADCERLVQNPDITFIRVLEDRPDSDKVSQASFARWTWR